MTKETITMTSAALIHPARTNRVTRLRTATAVVLASLIALLLGAGPARADLTLTPGSFSFSTSSDQAGAHADQTTSFSFVTDSNSSTEGNLRDTVINLPVGFAGSPASLPTCTQAQLLRGVTGACPLDSQVGIVDLAIFFGSTFSPQALPVTIPVYNMATAHGETAVLGFNFSGIVASNVVVSVRPGDHGLTAVVRDVNGEVEVQDTGLTLWGVPADPSHNALRGAICYFGSCSGGGLSSGANPTPFLSNPSACTGAPLTASLAFDSWQQSGRFNADGTPDLSDPNWKTAQASVGPYTGCDKLGFLPSLSVQPTTTQADSPSGYMVDLTVPQNNDPNGLATADLRKAVVTLPAGVVLSPSAADGLRACTDAQVGLGNADPPACPDGSKLGTATVTTPALPDQLTGNVYLAGPDSGPITGPPYRIFLTLSGDGVSVKLAGTATPDPVTGQLTTTFDNNPQLPFSELRLVFKDGPRAPLANPSTCGTFTTTSDLMPWSAPDSGPDATPSDSFQISGCGNPAAFAPSFAAGTTNAQAGAYAPFVLTFSRSDQDQLFAGLTATLPPGMSAKLAGVPLCSDSDASAGTCPAGSQVGSVETASGPGSHPFWLSGSAYLTGPYKGAPYGLAVEVPAIAGPFDLGTVVVRDALYIDPTTAQVTAVSDPFPTIIGGIPIQLRTVSIEMNRPGFTVNPTSCNPMSIGGALSSTGGLTAAVSSRFQVGGCQGLGFSPKLSFRLTGNGQTHSGNHPTLTATLTQGSGQANIRSAKVALPLSLALDINNSKNVCNYDTAQAVHGGAVGCPSSTIVGQATAVTPLLDQPLSGPVYLVQGIRFGKNGQRIHTLPSLLVPLRGQIAIDLRASSAVNGAQQLVTTFSNIPDAPVSKFTLTINGGRKGLLVITGRGQTICGKSQVASSDFGGQSGRADNQNDTMATPCSRVAHRRRHARRHTVRKHSGRR
jgi:hypothetical protein